MASRASYLAQVREQIGAVRLDDVEGLPSEVVVVHGDRLVLAA
jgi:hypothetical protein